MIDNNGIERNPRPYECINFEDLTEKQKAVTNFDAAKQPEWYCYYYCHRLRKYFPHRKPTVDEICNERFNYDK